MFKYYPNLWEKSRKVVGKADGVILGWNIGMEYARRQEQGIKNDQQIKNDISNCTTDDTE